MDGFSFSTDVRIRFAETDAQGIAHHASFVVWLEVARVAYLAAHAGGYQAIRERGFEALTTEVCVRYQRAAYFDEILRVWTRCGDLRGARFTYEYRIERDGVAAVVEVIAGPHRLVSLMTAEAVDDLALKIGDEAVCVVKATNVVVEVPSAREPR